MRLTIGMDHPLYMKSQSTQQKTELNAKGYHEYEQMTNKSVNDNMGK